MEPTKWISVKDRFPEYGEDVLCFIWCTLQSIPTRMIVGHYSTLDNFYDQDGALLPAITHWMPLPEPPKN